MSKSNINKKIAGGQLLPGVFVSLAISFLVRLLHIAFHSTWNVCCLLCCAFRGILDCFVDPSVCLPDRIGGRTGSFYMYLCPGQLYDQSSADVGWHFHLVGEI